MIMFDFSPSIARITELKGVRRVFHDDCGAWSSATSKKISLHLIRE